MRGKCLIISGGEFTELNENCRNADFVIACDKGYDYSQKLGITPDLFIGDFDSFSGEVTNSTQVVSLPSEKDDTDTMYAVRYALDNGYDEIVITCALGGRLDHAYANIQAGAFIASKGIPVTICGAKETVYLLSSGSISIPSDGCRYFSVFSYTEKCTGVSITGAKYPLSDHTLENTFPLGTSNEWLEDTVTVSVNEGTVLIISNRE